MKYFIDTEFFENGTFIDLISIGVVAEDGREMYAVSQGACLPAVSAWVRENVLPKLPPYGDPAWKSRVDIRDALLLFTGAPVHHRGTDPPLTSLPHVPDDKPEFWGYYADYDWVAVCQLFGMMMDLPKHWPKFCRDLKQLSCDVGSPKHPPASVNEHNALVDARWNRDLYAFLQRHR